MELTEKAKIYHNIWCCAFQRRDLYRGTPREQREHESILMCLNMKGAKWYIFDTDKKRFL